MKARRSELKHLMHTFFGSSPKEVMADLIDVSQKDMDEESWDEILKLIEEARKQGR